MKKYMSVILTLALCLGVFAGCGKKEEAAADRLAQIQSKGELVIALEGNWAPWSFHDDSDALVGYDVEVGRAIAEKLGGEGHLRGRRVGWSAGRCGGRTV